MSPADDRKLIKVVECHHVLWDNRMKEFRDKRLTQHGWKSVAELLNRDVDDVMYRWTNLRKQYSRKITRLRQRTTDESPEKPWHLMPLLAFLRPCITPRKRKHSSVHNNSSTSTEEISSSCQSDDSQESSPLVVRINPVEPPRNSLFYGIPENKPVPQSSGVQRKPFRKIVPKAKIGQLSNLPSEKKFTSELSFDRMKEEQSDNPSPVSSSRVHKQQPNVHKLSSAPEPQCDGLKPPQTAVRSLPLKKKKLKTSSERPSFAKSTNATLETERKPKPLAEKTTSSVAKHVSSETEKKQKVYVGKTLSSAVNSNSVSSETEKKVKTFPENSLSVSKSTNVPSEVFGNRGYDSDEHFLLSLADDFRKMDPRQKFECKVKMINMVCEQYIKN